MSIKPIRILALVTATWGYLLCTTTAFASGWPIKEFEVVFADPTTLFGSLLGAEPENVDVVKQEISRYLRKVADEYERMGFLPPRLEAKDGKYRIYFNNVPATQGSPALASCDSENWYLHLDEKMVSDGKVVDERLWEHLAHELFHMVQHAYGTCDENPGDFFVEGSAEAIGKDMAQRFMGIEKDRSTGERWGVRRYDYSLNRPIYAQPDTEEKIDANDDHFYMTSSFWRYLGEHVASGGRATIKEVQADYSYLHGLMKTPLASKQSGNVIESLDAGLRKTIGIGLQRAYAGFASTFAGYIRGNRFSLSVNTSPEISEEKFLKRVFGGCSRLKYQAMGAPATGSFDIEPVAARCMTVEFDTSVEFDLDINVRGVDPSGLTDLSIGTLGGLNVSGPIGDPQPAPVGGGYIATWRFRIKTDTPQTFILANVARTARFSVQQTFDLTLTATGFTHNQLPEQLSTKSRTANRKTRKPSNTEAPVADPIREAASEQLARDLSDLHAMSSSAVTIDHRDRKSKICNEPFRFETCSPSTTLSMELRPGSIADMTVTRGAGGTFAQMATAAQSIDDHGVENVISDLGALQQQAKKIVGARVDIVIPRIRFGFTGSFDNAEIRVSGPGGVILEAVGPQDAIRGGGHAFPLSGKVTIDEYTPLSLRGRFSAPLVDQVNADLEGQIDPVLSVLYQLEGQFSVASPYQQEPGFQYILPAEGDLSDMFSQDVAQFAPGIKKSTLDVIEAQTSRHALNESVPSAGEPGAFPSCQCGCASDASQGQDAYCMEVCSSRSLFCPRDNEPTTAGEDTDALRQRLVGFLESSNLNVSLRSFYLAEFDRARTDRERQLLLRTLKVPQAQ